MIVIAQAVDGSVLCLLENPPESINHLQDFIRVFDEDLVNRVRFQSKHEKIYNMYNRYWNAEYMGNPFENQARVGDMCNVLLDTAIYNSHTTAIDALWGGYVLNYFGY